MGENKQRQTGRELGF